MQNEKKKKKTPANSPESKEIEEVIPCFTKIKMMSAKNVKACFILQCLNHLLATFII